MRFLFPLLLLMLFAPMPGAAQAGAPQADLGAARLQGYYHSGDTTHFVFDARRYGVPRPQRVVVTGAFRVWSMDMQDAEWQLHPHPFTQGLWELAVHNPRFTVIPPSTPFKFRVDDGRWLDPPATAPNVDGGNLIFEKGLAPPRLRAELRSGAGSRLTVWAELSGAGTDRPLDVSAYRLTRYDGTVVPIASVAPNTASGTLVVPDALLDPGVVYYLDVTPPGRAALRTRIRFDGLWRNLYSPKPLGAEIVRNAEGQDVTTVRVFAPRANRLTLFLYTPDDAGRHATPDHAAETVEMTRDADGVWETTLAGDRHGVWYDFRVYGPDGPGSLFYNQRPAQITDPYARVSDDSFGKARIWRPTTPAPPLAAGRPKMEDVVAYEVHVQDFAHTLPVSPEERGTFAGMMRPGLTNSRGAAIGFDYLVGLGVNVVHLMPVQEFLHYPDAEWQRVFRDTTDAELRQFAREQGITDENYDWGYRTTHAFAIESRFRTRGTEPGSERDQFRDLVAAFHARGMAVIVDIVPNHTGENMDGRFDLFNWNALDKLYYYRTDDAGQHIGPFGNEVKFEERPMVQRWLIDQCRALMNEFGVDGFRVDLAGQVDQQSLLALKAALPPDAIVYGEPWIPPSDPDVTSNPDWAWYKTDAPITYFQDDARNSFKGPTSNPQSKRTDRGFAGGNVLERARTMTALRNAFPDERDPNIGLSYLDIHDNWALADQFASSGWDGRYGVDEGAFRIAATLLFTGLGPIVVHGGTEIMRSKGSSGLFERDYAVSTGRMYFHGKRDTYNVLDGNLYEWETVGARAFEVPLPTPGVAEAWTDAANRGQAAPGQTARPNDYAAMQRFWTGLAALRASDAGAVFRVGETVPEGYYRFIAPANGALLGYVTGGRVLTLLNVGDQPDRFRGIRLPSGNWKLVVDGAHIDLNGLGGDDATLVGGRTYALPVGAQGVRVWVRE